MSKQTPFRTQSCLQGPISFKFCNVWLLAEAMRHSCLVSQFCFFPSPTNHPVHSRKGQTEGMNTGRSLLCTSDVVWMGFSLSQGGGETAQGCFTAEQPHASAKTWMDGPDELPCVSLHTFIEKGNTSPVLHLYFQAGAQSEPLPCHVLRDAIYYVGKKSRNLGGKIPQGTDKPLR